LKVGGYLVTVIRHRRLQTYVVAEPDQKKALAILAEKLHQSSVEPLAPIPLSKAALKDYDVKPGCAKRLHL
jgi:hypothetical protein